MQIVSSVLKSVKNFLREYSALRLWSNSCQIFRWSKCHSRHRRSGARQRSQVRRCQWSRTRPGEQRTARSAARKLRSVLRVRLRELLELV